MSKSSDAVKRWREKTKARLIEAMGGGCVCCKYNRCARALEFHHKSPEEKDFGIGLILAHIVSWDRIVREVKKCVMVCSNCHGEIHEEIDKNVAAEKITIGAVKFSVLRSDPTSNTVFDVAKAIIDEFNRSLPDFVEKFWMAYVHGMIGWVITVPLACWILHFFLRATFRKVLPQPSAPCTPSSNSDSIS